MVVFLETSCGPQLEDVIVRFETDFWDQKIANNPLSYSKY